MIKIGIDLGITSAKLVGLRDEKVVFTENLPNGFSPEIVSDVLENVGCSISDVESIHVTGVGADKITEPVCGLNPVTVSEFEANANGARYLCGLDRFIIVSMGTGTSFVMVEGDSYQYLGGSALGGGTLAGLSQMVFDGNSSTSIFDLAENGNLDEIDLHLDEVTEINPPLPFRITASNLRKGDRKTSKEDAALGFLNLVIQNLGVMAYLSGKGYGISEFVCLGGVTRNPLCKHLLEQVSKLFKCNFILPELASFGTAIGAALAKKK